MRRVIGLILTGLGACLIVFAVLLPTYVSSGVIKLTYWADPDTGALLNVNEDQKLTLVNPATGAPALVLFDADLAATPASVTAVMKLDRSGRNKLTLIDTVLPLATGIGGAVLLVAGVLLWHKSRGDAEAGSAIRAAGLAAVAPEDTGPPATDAGRPAAGPGRLK